jgi:hypothetical protein
LQLKGKSLICTLLDLLEHITTSEDAHSVLSKIIPSDGIMECNHERPLSMTSLANNELRTHKIQSRIVQDAPSQGYWIWDISRALNMELII